MKNLFVVVIYDGINEVQCGFSYDKKEAIVIAESSCASLVKRNLKKYEVYIYKFSVPDGIEDPATAYKKLVTWHTYLRPDSFFVVGRKLLVLHELGGNGEQEIIDEAFTIREALTIIKKHEYDDLLEGGYEPERYKIMDKKTGELIYYDNKSYCW